MNVISLNVDDIGLSKLYVMPQEIRSELIRNCIRYLFDTLDSLRIKRIKKLANTYGLPVTWAVVPFYLDTYSHKKTRFDKALPKMYGLIKSYIEKGDEAIQHGNCHYYPDERISSTEEFHTEKKSLSLQTQKVLLDEGWQALMDMGLGSKKIIQFPAWKADNNSINAISALKYRAILAGNFLYPQTIFKKVMEKTDIATTHQVKLDKLDIPLVFEHKEPINLAMHPSSKSEFSNLKKFLVTSKDQNIKFVTVSQTLRVSLQ